VLPGNRKLPLFFGRAAGFETAAPDMFLN
jgi:hypothetical protein